MSEKLVTKGIVLRATATKEADYILNILTDSLGRIAVVARGARRKGSRIAAGSELLAFSELILYQRGNWYYLDEASTISLFDGIRQDIELLSLASYFAEMTECDTAEDEPVPEILSLLLNSLYALDTLQKPQSIVKAAFELKLLALSGYEPLLDGCAVCGTHNPKEPVFDAQQGVLLCRECAGHGGGGLLPLDAGSFAAMRHVLFSEPKRMLSFSLSGEAASFSRDILWDYDILVHLDLIFARGELSYRMNAMRPELKKDGSVYLRHARHPLLDPAKAVPIDIELGRSFDTLVITGPNTGGKTVSLKTLGLLCLMTQCGLHIPCDDRSAVSIFSSVLADIGDEQSIEQSLSTFSAHMKNIVQILDEADEHCLILFDELGAGTDPVEGAALAIAVIEQARSQGAKIAATTHYAELKTFAMTTAGVENASCEFDVETLCPTYKLLIGIPGKSNAFAISKRLGLSEAVIEKAKAQMDSESIRFEDVLTQLEQKRQQLEKEKAEVDRLYAQREEDARKAREFRTQMERAKENARSRGEAEAKRLLAEAKSVADDTFRELDALRKQQKKLDAQQMNAQRAEIMHNIKQARDAAGVRDESAEPIPKPSRPIEVGDLVEIPGTRRQAEVTAVKDGTLTLKAGVLQMKVKADEVRLIEAAERAATAKKQPQFAPSQRILRTASAARELDIRGMETLEAESVLDNYIDAAVMAHLETVTIIHGKGTGALRKAVHASLQRNKAVKSFRLGNYGEGESGVTVVELK